MKLIDNAEVTGDSEVFKATDLFSFINGRVAVVARGTDWTGVSIQLFGGFSVDPAEMVPLENGTFTESIAKVIDIPQGFWIYASLTHPFLETPTGNGITLEIAGD